MWSILITVLVSSFVAILTTNIFLAISLKKIEKMYEKHYDDLAESTVEVVKKYLDNNSK